MRDTWIEWEVDVEMKEFPLDISDILLQMDKETRARFVATMWGLLEMMAGADTIMTSYGTYRIPR